MIDYDGLNRLAYQIKTETGRAANTALRVGTLFEDIIAALAEGDNTGLLDQITNLKNDISKIINMIKDLNTEIDTSIISRIEANERNISDINSTINKIDTSISNIKGDINTINGSISNHTKLIEGLQGDINTINESITSIKGSIENITNTISDITTDIEDLTTRVSTNETNITELTKRLDAIDLKPIIASIDKLKVDLGDLTERVSTTEVDINSLKTSVTNISNNLAEEIDRAIDAEEAIQADLTGHISNTVMHTTQAEKDKLSHLANDAEATYAKKTELPDMTNVFYKNKGGTVTKSTTFTDIVLHDQPIFMQKGAYMGFSSDTVNLPLLYFSIGDHSYNFLSTIELPFWSLLLGAPSFDVMLSVENNAHISRPVDGGVNKIYKVWDEGNDGHNSGLDADLLDGHHWTDFALKSDIPEVDLSGYLPLTAGSTKRITGNLYVDQSIRYTAGGAIDAPLMGLLTDSSKNHRLILGSDRYDTLISSKSVLRALINHREPEILHEDNSVYVVSSYPTDLSSYPDGAIFIKTS